MSGALSSWRIRTNLDFVHRIQPLHLLNAATAAIFHQGPGGPGEEENLSIAQFSIPNHLSKSFIFPSKMEHCCSAVQEGQRWDRSQRGEATERKGCISCLFQSPCEAQGKLREQQNLHQWIKHVKLSEMWLKAWFRNTDVWALQTNQKHRATWP